MKTLISNSGQHRLNWAGIKKSSLFITFIFALLSFVFSSSTPVTSEYQEKTGDGANKKLMILEKLEAGKDLSSEEIRSSFDDFRLNDSESEIFCWIDFQEINKQVSESMKELEKNIRAFHNSEEFISMHEDLLRWNEKFKEDFEKMMEELKHSTREKKYPDNYREDKNN